MPISQDDLDRGRATPPDRTAPLPTSYTRSRTSEESIRTEFCEGPLPSPSPRKHDAQGAFPSSWTESPLVMNRADHIRRLKQEQNSLWSQNFEQQRELEVRRHIVPEIQFRGITSSLESSAASVPREEAPFGRIENGDEEGTASRIQAGMEIERPRSALHSGDFTEQRAVHHECKNSQSSQLDLDIGRVTDSSPWTSTSPPRQFTEYPLEQRGTPYSTSPYSTPYRSRAPSLSSSYSSSFVLKPPTSPLVQSESNDDLDFSSRDPIDIAYGFPSSSRRHTLNVSRSLQSTPASSTTANYSRPLPQLRRDATFPYQAHQPLRSITSHHGFHHGSSPQKSGGTRARRPSISDASPLQHASMVGSYEESILRGRMSTTPSKPLDFVAQIGVLGLGDCRPSLRCPAHVVVPFPAVFYSYATTTHSRTGKNEDGPSPYVGQIDLENGLAKSEQKEPRRRHNHPAATRNTEEMEITHSQEMSTDRELRKAQKQKRMSTAPRAPPGGSYRIPEKGQLQIIIKNPNKTAVKLFLVPYDLTGMEPGTKTFIRQRSYSAGPIIDMGAASSTPSEQDRPILRYLIHLHICSSARGRFFLYKSIRVVFANRVPDGKEKLRNEVQHPEPRFSAYKPMREVIATGSLAGANLAAEKAFRRRSSGFPLSGAQRPFDAGATEKDAFGKESNIRSTTPVDPIPFNLFQRRAVSGEGVQDSLLSMRSGSVEQMAGNEGLNREAYDKLHKGELGYGGPFAHTRRVEEGLLARKLRGLGVGPEGVQDFGTQDKDCV